MEDGMANINSGPSDMDIPENFMFSNNLDLGFPEIDLNAWNELADDSTNSVNSLNGTPPHNIDTNPNAFASWTAADAFLTCGLTPPDTPPSSDRSTPPIINDVNSLLVNEFHSTITSKAHELKFPIILPNVSFSSPVLPPCVQQNLHLPQNMKLTDEEKRNISQLKKEARKVRNRESAILSRQKKKEEFNFLEAINSSLNKENFNLKEENIALKKRISYLESENMTLKLRYQPISIKGPTKRKAVVSLFAVVFMLCYNFTPPSNTLFPENPFVKQLSSESASIGNINRRSGRSLLWSDGNLNKGLNFLENTFNEMNNENRKGNGTKCNSFINKTESIRLEKELRGFVLRVEKEIRTNKVLTAARKKSLPLSRMRNLLQSQNHRSKKLGLLNTEDFAISYTEILKAIHPREDTYYFVSFPTGSNLLLPAESNSTIIRPRFTIVVPSVVQMNSTTNSTGFNQVHRKLAMTQIECEVMNMNMEFVKDINIGEKKEFKIKKVTSNRIKIKKNRLL